MHIDVHSSIPQHLTDPAWELYVEAFDELRTTAVQRHVMYRAEFDDLIADPRVEKFLGFDDHDHFCALSTATNDLDAVPLVSPDYFERHWPAYFGTGRIFYIGFLGIHPECRNTGLFALMCEAIYRRVSAGDPGVVAFDVCRRNEQVFAFPEAIRDALERLSGEVRPHRLDEQTYWLYELPRAA